MLEMEQWERSMSDVTFQVAGFGAVGLLATLKQLLAAVAASIPKGADSVWSERLFARHDERASTKIRCLAI